MLVTEFNKKKYSKKSKIYSESKISAWLSKLKKAVIIAKKIYDSQVQYKGFSDVKFINDYDIILKHKSMKKVDWTKLFR